MASCDQNKRWLPGTRTIHHPQAESPSEPISAPIFQSATFLAEKAATIAEYVRATHPPAFYTRWGNPTTEVLEKVLADLEGGERGLAFSSGMAAISTTLLALLSPGDHVVAGRSLYSATTEIMNEELRQLGIEVDFVDATDPENFANFTRQETRLFYFETPNNPTLALTDIQAVSSLAKEHGALCVADNTFATPVGQNPLSLGVDVVLHSATKYISGHSDVVAGIVVSNGEIVDRIWQKLKLLGGCLDPHAAWLLLRGLKTLGVRMERHHSNALLLAHKLQEHPAVLRVMYPGLQSHPQHELALRQMTGFGGMVSFELRGGLDAGLRFVESTELMILAVSLGGVETLIEHPASMTHGTLTKAQLQRAGIAPGLIRISVGIEEPNDLLADLEQALGKL